MHQLMSLFQNHYASVDVTIPESLFQTKSMSVLKINPFFFSKLNLRSFFLSLSTSNFPMIYDGSIPIITQLTAI
jgi:hypothetical protein